LMRRRSSRSWVWSAFAFLPPESAALLTLKFRSLDCFSA
jgi:hypothetical protein